MTGYPGTAVAWAAELARAACEIEAVAAVLAGHAVEVGENTTSSWQGGAVEVETAAGELTGAAARLRAAAALLEGARSTVRVAGRDSAAVPEQDLVWGYRYRDRVPGPATGESGGGRVLEVVAGRCGRAPLVFTVAEDRGARDAGGSGWQVTVGAADPLVLADPDVTAWWIELAFGAARDLGQVSAMLVRAGAQESAALGAVERVAAACPVRPDRVPVTGIDAAPGASAAAQTVRAEQATVADFVQGSVHDDAHLAAERAARGGRPVWESDADIADYHRVWGD